MKLTASGPYLRDEHGRVVLLRGVNLGGSTKVPFTPNGSTWNKDLETFFNTKEVSFVGRPFPLEEADEHFGRLREWGLTFLRFLVTWEAIEHEGPGIYDMEYIAYVRRLLEKAHSYGITCFVDPHQDAWSRWAGGDGMPGWTHEILGMDITRFSEVGAAVVEQLAEGSLPRMIWPTNHFKLATATMFTLFFAGKDFAPKTMVEGVNIQEYLQDHYIKAMVTMATHLKDLPNVVGYGSLNEPSMGWIGLEDVDSYPWKLTYGACPTPFQSMCLASGVGIMVPIYEYRSLGFKCVGKKLMNPKGVSIWKGPSVWEQNGVFQVNPDTGVPTLLRPKHFTTNAQGQPVDFYRDHLIPFIARYTEAIHAVVPDALIFAEGSPLCNTKTHTYLDWQGKGPKQTVLAEHWYDGLPLFLKTFHEWLFYDNDEEKLWLGPWIAQRGRVRCIRRIVERAVANNVPPLVGEVGIAFDMGNKKAYKTGDFSMQLQALDCTMRALESNMVSFTLWNYTSDNSNKYGDNWNGEDLSLFSRDQARGEPSIHD
eukprot:RCo019818